MNVPPEIRDSPRRFAEKHIQRYLDSNGTDTLWHGVPSLLITTLGRKSGMKRRTGLIYREYQDGYIVIASQGGEPSHPSWFRNVQANGFVELQVGPEVFDAEVTVTSGAQREELWNLMVDMWPEFEAYQARTERRIPVLLLRRKPT